jgi:hypothetical protein
MQEPDHPVLRVLDADETLHALAPAVDAELVVTDRRIAVVFGDRVALNITYEGLRRVQFDIERQRPATLVLVPHEATAEPQVLAIPVEGYAVVSQALALVGEKLHQLD